MIYRIPQPDRESRDVGPRRVNRIWECPLGTRDKDRSSILLLPSANLAIIGPGRDLKDSRRNSGFLQQRRILVLILLFDLTIDTLSSGDGVMY